MEMMSASRMKRAQDAILAARPYADELHAALARVTSAVSEEVDPLLARRPIRRIGLIVMTTDRGLAGALDSNTVRAALRYIAEHPPAEGTNEPVEVTAITIGRKGRDQLRRAGVPIAAHFQRFGDRPTFADVTPVARLVTEDFLAETYDEISVVYPAFQSTLSQYPDVLTILPVRRPGPTRARRRRSATTSTCSSHRPMRCSAGCCRTTSPSTCIGPCWRRTRPSSRHG